MIGEREDAEQVIALAGIAVLGIGKALCDDGIVECGKLALRADREQVP